MTVFCLLRHAAALRTGHSLLGRTPGVHLTAEGRAQAEELARALRFVRLSALYSSPIERSAETAAVIANHLDLRVTVSQALCEVDYGEWTGKDFSELARDPRWARFNSSRSVAPIPDGEMALRLQARVVEELERLRALHPDQIVAAVSHAEIIRVVVCHYAGIPLDLSLRLDIRLGSASVIALSMDEARIAGINLTRDLEAAVSSIGLQSGAGQRAAARGARAAILT